jgi:CheY-like chemotaxis protein
MLVLLADKHTDTTEMVATVLSDAGARVITARDGEEALSLFEERRPQVCMLDLALPRITGFDFARRARNSASFNHTRIIAFTGWADTRSIEQAAETGFDYYLVKPALPAVIKSFVFAPPPEPLIMTSTALRARSAMLMKKSQDLLLRSREIRERAARITRLYNSIRR